MMEGEGREKMKERIQALTQGGHNNESPPPGSEHEVLPQVSLTVGG